MYQESQWQLIGNCIHCNCPIYKMDGKIKWPEGECRCELERETISRKGSKRNSNECHGRPRQRSFGRDTISNLLSDRD